MTDEERIRYMTDDSLTDEERIRAMLDGDRGGLIPAILVAEDAWGVGEWLWVGKDVPNVKLGAFAPSSTDDYQLIDVSCRFYAKPFYVDAVQGLAIWFSSSRRLVLCGWVPPEREADAANWTRVLDAKLMEHVTRILDQLNDLTDEQRAAQFAATFTVHS